MSHDSKQAPHSHREHLPLLDADHDVLCTDFDVERITKRKRKTLQKDRVYGGGIPFIRLGRLVRYRRSDIDAWLAARPALRSTSEADERARKSRAA